MDSTSGLNMSIIGITTVYIALSMLAVVVSAMARFLNDDPDTTTPGAAAPTTATEATADPDPQLRSVALAAFALHHHVTRRRRFAALRTTTGGTPWLQAARAEQASTRATRG